MVLVVFSEDYCLVPQFWTTEHPSSHNLVISVSNSYSELSVENRTAFDQSCGNDRKMALNLSNEQNGVLKSLYRNGRKIVNSESHINFLTKSLDLKFNCQKVFSFRMSEY